MKKMCAFLACLTLVLCLMVSGALAADATLMQWLGEGEEYRYISQMVAAGDTAYFFVRLDNNEASIYAWQEEEQEALWAEGLLFVGYFDKLEDVQSWLEGSERDPSIAEKGISYLFSDGENLMGLNHLTGDIWALEAENGVMQSRRLTTIRDTSFFYHVEDDYAYTISPLSVLAAGGKLLWFYNDWDNATGQSIYRVMSVDLIDGSVKKAAVDYPAVMTGYKDGKVLILCRNEMDSWDSQKKQYKPYDIVMYDPAADKAEKLGELQTEEWMQYAAYSPALDMLVWQENTRVMGLKDFKEKTQVAYVPLSGGYSMTVLGESFVASMGDGVIARTMQENFRTDQYLNILNGYMDEGARAFAAKYPQVPVYSVGGQYSDAELLSITMNAGEKAPDVLTMEVAYSPFDTLKDKGYCADLSVYPELKAYVEALYPVYREAVTGQNGEIFAVPMSVYSYDGYFVNRHVMEKMGLAMEDIPTNFVELCEFATRWNEEFVDEFPDYALLEYTEHYKERMFDIAVDEWVRYCSAKDIPLRFDDPIFREMVAAVEKMEIQELDASMKRTDPEKSEYKQALIWRNSSVVGSWTDFTKEDSDRIFLPMTMTKDTDYVEGAYMQIAFINPKSQHKELAAEYLAYQIEDVSDSNKAALLTTHAKPVERDNYQDLVKSAEENLTEMEQNLAQAKPEEKKDWEMIVAEQKAYIARLPERRWRISQGALDSYINLVLPGVYVRTPNALESAAVEFDTLGKRYKDGQISIDQFIREIDGKLRMMQMEDY